ncbi:MAG: hypothetical protein AAF891_10555 [Pseudomonadota bacterium]
MNRFFAALVALVVVAGCENIDDLSVKPKPIGEFALGHNIVVAPNIVMGPASREASGEDWINSVTKAIGDRFERYDGNQLYHFGISLEGYVLAQPGLPVVLSPKSVLILKLTVWDDAAGEKLNAEPEQITVLETLDGDTIVGSGLTKTAEEQMETLSVNAAKLIQRYITRQHAQNQWFKRRPETQAALDAAAANPPETSQTTENAGVAPVDTAANTAVHTSVKAPKDKAQTAPAAAAVEAAQDAVQTQSN